MPPSPLDDSPTMPPSDTASSSSSSSSPPAIRHRLMRKRSPSPPLPHLYTHHLRPYSPPSREADIARLLDPAYASPAPYSPLNRSPRMAVKELYVDHHGDLHDPDFRDFPPFGHSHFQSRRPQWEREYADEEDEDEEDYEVEQQPQRRRPSSSTTYHPPPVYFPYEEPASYESRYLEEDGDEEGEQLERTPLKEKCFYRRPRSPPKKAQDEKQSPNEGNRIIQADSEWTPTCTQSLRRQWQAITLSFRFSLFRTKRRLRRRMTG